MINFEERSKDQIRDANCPPRTLPPHLPGADCPLPDPQRPRRPSEHRVLASRCSARGAQTLASSVGTTSELELQTRDCAQTHSQTCRLTGPPRCLCGHSHSDASGVSARSQPHRPGPAAHGDASGVSGGQAEEPGEHGVAGRYRGCHASTLPSVLALRTALHLALPAASEPPPHCPPWGVGGAAGPLHPACPRKTPGDPRQTWSPAGRGARGDWGHFPELPVAPHPGPLS